MDNFDLRKFLAEGKLHEAEDKDLQKLGEEMEKQLKAAGLDTHVFGGKDAVPNDAKSKIAKNPKLAALAYTKTPGLGGKMDEILEVIVHYDSLEDLQKIASSLGIEKRELVTMEGGELVRIKLSRTLAESLNEETEALDRESVIDMAQMVADEFTEEDANVGGTHMIYKVGKVDGLGFELDTQATENTPADDAKYGTGEGWGGSFRIEVLPNGYEIRNSEKGGLVATMDMEDGFRMLSADESRAELEGEPDVDYKNDELDMKRMEEGEEVAEAQEEVTEYSSKMKKSELKEMIRQSILAEAGANLTEEEEDEKDVDVDADVDVDIDADVKADEDEIIVKQDADTDLGGTVGDVQDNLEAALEAARELGDEKLEDQIGNTLTFFTRTHVVGK